MNHTNDAVVEQLKVLPQEPDMTGTIEAEFRAFHAANPKVYDLFVQFARELQAAGKKRGGAKLIMERIRWEVYISLTNAADDFKLNNNYTSRYARKAMNEHTELRGFFKLRCIKRI